MNKHYFIHVINPNGNAIYLTQGNSFKGSLKNSMKPGKCFEWTIKEKVSLDELYECILNGVYGITAIFESTVSFTDASIKHFLDIALDRYKQIMNSEFEINRPYFVYNSIKKQIDDSSFKLNR